MSIAASLFGLILATNATLRPPPPAPPPDWRGAVIGQSFAELAAAYPRAKSSGTVQAATLELGSVSYSGVSWSKVVLAFDVSRHLDHVTFTVSDINYSELKARLDATLDANPTLSDGVQIAAASAYDVEMRICQLDDGEVDVTFERPHYEV